MNATYIMEAPDNFRKIFKKKRPIMVVGERFLHWDNALVHTAAIVTDWLAARHVQMLQHPPYLPDLAPADFFLFPKVKKELAGLILMRDLQAGVGGGCEDPHGGGLRMRRSSSGIAAAKSVWRSAAAESRNFEK